MLQSCPTRLARFLGSSLRYPTPLQRSLTSKTPPLPFTTRKGFTKAEDALLLKRLREKTPLKVIASELDRTYKSVTSRLRRLREGSPRPQYGVRKYSEDDAKTMLSLAAAGTSSRDIAKRYGMPTHRLDSLMRELRARQSTTDPQYGTHTQAADRARIISLLLDQNLSHPEIARQTKWSLRTVRRVARSDLNPQRAPPRKAFAKYTAHEDAQILELRETQRLSWSEIAKQMAGRSASGLSSRHYGYLRDRQPPEQSERKIGELK
ncbi:hypothetical protein LTR56_017542 [Elasticomyces elasticus]|nr:hypothetical protein LTR22_022402 [Elasticomyces elasticus]KAK3630254.1 hypothetical protein LTR56_017542 [Elasticomyces elasticus]KAK4913908.1 hypothetical protein LTR49_017834 [Elasticomyces elasticus]KAK5766369.1 hypothetical protein LTS12_003581 [Elasticomyces elasticus]